MNDKLCTRDYEMHHRFYFTLVIGVSLTILTSISLMVLNPLYVFIRSIVFAWFPLYALFILTLVTNNVYQVWAHTFVFTKILGFKKIVPLGSKDQQTLGQFTLSNVLDILGFLMIFVHQGYAHPFLCLVAATHYGFGITAIFFNKTFQEYYIANPRAKNNSDSFRYCYWLLGRAIFVLLDALTRGYMIYKILG